uniref:SCP domain-containing protein n=1 Tax=Panagrolaimus superbus TaxID=310955 RepID=A0A914Z440_9BILA
MALVTDPSYDGAAYNQASKIVVGGNYAKTHPNDIGMIAHETFHSVQAYTHEVPSWITEGLANYVGNEFSESGQSLGKYISTDHYTQGYSAAAKFFAYLEQRFPGIVKSVDSIMRNGQHGEGQFWITLTGYPVDQLWDAYVQASAAVCPAGNGVTTWNNAARDLALKLMNDKRSEIANGTFTMSNGAIAPAAKNMNKLTYSCEYEEAAQNYVNTCNDSNLLDYAFGSNIGLLWVVNSINDALTTSVPYYFSFIAANQNGNAMLMGGEGHFAYLHAGLT